MPEVLANIKAIINVQNNANKCFLWSIPSALHPADDHSNTVIIKKWKKEFDEALNGVVFPVKLSDVPKFAKKTNMSINVYWFNNNNSYIAPLQITKEEEEKYIDLLYTFYKNHYCWIKDLGKLNWVTNNKKHRTFFFCKMCLRGFHSEEKLGDHKTYCGAHKPVKIANAETGRKHRRV